MVDKLPFMKGDYQLSDEALSDFMAAYKEVFGEISREEARQMAMGLLSTIWKSVGSAPDDINTWSL